MWATNNTPRRLSTEERLNICRSCPFVQMNRAVGLTCGTLLKPTYDSFGNQLTCGCVLHAKARLAGQHCPQKKW